MYGVNVGVITVIRDLLLKIAQNRQKLADELSNFALRVAIMLGYTKTTIPLCRSYINTASSASFANSSARLLFFL